MILKRRVALNGVWLDQVDSRIVISSVEPADGKDNISAVDAAAGYGQRITGNRRSTVDMVVKFRILEHGHSGSGQQARAEVLEKINAWAAAGGELTVDYKPGRRLNVILAQAPGEGSLWDYTKEFTLTFRAYAIPYWEDAVASGTSFNASAGTGSRSIIIEGSAKTQCDVSVANTSGQTMNTCSLSVGGQNMSFTGLGLASGETLVIDHVDGLVRIRIRGTGGAYRSAMAMRTGADDYMVAPGTVTCGYTLEKAGRITVGWRARYL